MGKIYKTIAVNEKVHKEFMLFKIKTDAKSASELISKSIKCLKKNRKYWDK